MRHFDIWAGESFGRRLNIIFCVTFHSSQRYRYGQGACFWKVPWTFWARKASWQTAIRLLCKADLLTCFLMSEKTKSIAKFDGLEPQVWWLRASPFRRYEGNSGVRNRPEMFRNFWETGLGSDKISVMHYWLEEQSKTETCIIYKVTSASTCRVSFLSRAYTIHTDKQRSSFRACHVFNFRHMQRKTCAHATCFTGNTRCKGDMYTRAQTEEQFFSRVTFFSCVTHRGTSVRSHSRESSGFCFLITAL